MIMGGGGFVKVGAATVVVKVEAECGWESSVWKDGTTKNAKANWKKKMRAFSKISKYEIMKVLHKFCFFL